uniref:ARAD1D50864p n=1 Tax=Blastobotrys adeninivorans TaxID=409370 RepID=A0A060TDU7_BLAAD
MVENKQRQTGYVGFFLGAVVIGAFALLITTGSPLKSIGQYLFFQGDGEVKYVAGASEQFGICQQPLALSPKNTEVESFIRDKVESAEYREEIISKLSGIIKIPSESYDDLGPIGEDERWDVFYKMEDYIKVNYPDVFRTVKLDHANTHGLVLTWEGTVPTSVAKPILMLAHQDVVPVLAETVQDWTHPPYEGHYDGEIIWGRGATDDKGYLISIIESVDLLIKSGFTPKRTIILAFGCDEEISGENCGRPISQLLHKRYGDDGIYLIMDEGSVGIQREFDQSFAMVSVAEKGYLDVGINVTSTGGHASNPPDHSSIGIMAEIIQAIEDNPFSGRVTRRNPMFGYLECAAVHAPSDSYPSQIRGLLQKAADGDERAQRNLADSLDSMRYYFRTSQSVGKINGGVKINAIPEAVTTMVNLRLSVESSVAEVMQHYESLVKPIALRHGMTFEGFDSTHESNDKRKVSLFGVDGLEPAPVSSVNTEQFKVLSGTIKNTLGPLEGDDQLIVTPYLMVANTDTKFFWNVTRNIYRFTPINLVQSLNRAHTTDEFIRADEFVREPLFFSSLILNADDAVDI